MKIYQALSIALALTLLAAAAAAQNDAGPVV